MPSEDALYALDLIRQRRPDDLKYTDYRYGRQSVYLSFPPRFRKAWGEVIDRHNVNMCRAVIDVKADRLNIEAWEGNEDANTLWHDEGGAQFQNEVHQDAGTTGDSYLLPWPAGTFDGPIRWNPLRSDEAIVVYSDDDPVQADFGVKLWVVESRGRTRQTRYRVNVLYPDRVERFISPLIGSGGTGIVRNRELDLKQLVDGNLLTAYGNDVSVVEDEADDLPHIFDHQFGEMPLVHFKNGKGRDRRYGLSDLADVLPLQDGLNYSSINALVAGEMYGLPLRVLYGYELMDDDGDGKPDNLPNPDPRNDKFLAFPGINTRVEQLSPADLTALLSLVDAYKAHIAAAAKVPAYMFSRDGTQVPSGESLRVEEQRLVADVTSKQQSHTPSWTKTMRLTGIEAQPKWADPSMMDVTEEWDLVQKKVDVGYPLRQALIDQGREESDVDDILTAAEDLAANLGSQAVRAFRDGADPAQLLRE